MNQATAAQTKKKSSKSRLPEMAIVRADKSGVFFGKLLYLKGTEAKIENARRIFYWDGAASLSQLAVSGTVKPNECKFPDPVPSVILTDVIEVLEVTEKAIQSINNVPIWRA